MTDKLQNGDATEGKHEIQHREAAGGAAETDARLDRALADFRSSVHAWGEAALSRARIAEIPVRRSWRLAAGWALGCALMAGGVTGGILEHQQQQKAARIAAAAEQQAQQQQVAAAQERAQPREGVQYPNLMAKVDSDTAQEVPDAMQPLAQLMEVDGNR